MVLEEEIYAWRYLMHSKRQKTVLEPLQLESVSAFLYNKCVKLVMFKLGAHIYLKAALVAHV